MNQICVLHSGMSERRKASRSFTITKKGNHHTSSLAPVRKLQITAVSMTELYARKRTKTGNMKTGYLYINAHLSQELCRIVPDTKLWQSQTYILITSLTNHRFSPLMKQLLRYERICKPVCSRTHHTTGKLRSASKRQCVSLNQTICAYAQIHLLMETNRCEKTNTLRVSLVFKTTGQRLSRQRSV
jgi:hypothetical protein